jgi:hypothetical protein
MHLYCIVPIDGTVQKIKCHSTYTYKIKVVETVHLFINDVTAYSFGFSNHTERAPSICKSTLLCMTVDKRRSSIFQRPMSPKILLNSNLNLHGTPRIFFLCQPYTPPISPFYSMRHLKYWPFTHFDWRRRTIKKRSIAHMFLAFLNFDWMSEIHQSAKKANLFFFFSSFFLLFFAYFPL